MPADDLAIEDQAEQGLGVEAFGAQDLAIHVCTACRRARADLPDGFDQPGIALADALSAALAKKGSGIPVLPVECLAVCKRPCTLAFAAEGKWTYLIGDLDADSHLDEIVSAARAYAASANGIVPWKERPTCFRKGVVARVPPLPARQQG